MSSSLRGGVCALAACLTVAAAQADWRCLPDGASGGWACQAGDGEAALSSPPAPAPSSRTPTAPPPPQATEIAPTAVDTPRNVATDADASPPASTARLETCPAQLGPSPAIPWPDTGPGAGPGADAIGVDADRVSGDTRAMRLQGNVRVRRGDARLRADEVTIDQDSNTVDAEGDLLFKQQGVAVEAARGRTQVRGDAARFEELRYELTELGARGEAASAERQRADELHLQSASYTTCALNRPAWLLQADEVHLNEATQVGTARNVKVRFMGVPLAYTPWASFPMGDQRKSGLLVPSVGQSDSNGFELAVPYYWNISPQRDATLTPRLLARRGMQLNGEYRYLTTRSRGILAAEFLPSDRVYDDDRSLVSYRHQGRFGTHWSTDVNAANVSDEDYFDDLSHGLDLVSTTHLERRVDLAYHRPAFYALARVQDFQVLDSLDEPYTRLPHLEMRGRLLPPERPLNLEVFAQGVNFDHSDDDRLPTGPRLDLRPTVSYDLRRPAWYVRPSAALRYTRYSVDRPDGGSEDLDRSTPIASLDAGAFFERPLQWRGSWMQTLEPRLYYLYVPYRRQDRLPVYDTDELDFSFAQLFRDNRFSSADRQGDANQLTLALTSRILDREDGSERLRLSLGEILYFADRRVTLPGRAPEDDRYSEWVAELAWQMTRSTAVRGTLVYDPEDERTRQAVYALQVRPDPDRLINLSYRMREEDIEQTDVSFAWPLSRRWRAVGRWNYSLLADETLEALAGVQYETCCWAVRLVARHYLTDDGLEHDNAIHAQLVLKGLGAVGDRVNSLLERSIVGYARDRRVE